MIVVSVGLALVGLSSFLAEKSDENSRTIILGVMFVVIGQFCNAVQVVVEETLLKRRMLKPLQVVGSEGMWGFLLMSIAVLPVMYFIPGHSCGSYENSIDALRMIGNNSILLFAVVLYCITIAFYNFFGQSVTKSLTAVHRTLVDGTSVICIWCVGLCIYYIFESKTYGESWNQYSWMQVIGFVILLVGNLVYNLNVILAKATKQIVL